MIKNIYKDYFSFWELFLKSISFFKDNFKYILFISLIIYLPIDIASYYLSENIIVFEDFSFEERLRYIKNINWISSIFWIIVVTFVIFLVKWDVDWEKKSFNKYFKLAISNWWKAIIWSICYWFFVWFFTLYLIIIPWIIFWIYWIFFLQIILLKKIKILDSIDYSIKLVKWNWWKIFLSLIFLYSLLILLSLWMTFIPYIENLFIDIFITFIIDLLYLFIVIFFTFKFLNLDRDNNLENKKEVEKNEIEEKNKERVEL